MQLMSTRIAFPPIERQLHLIIVQWLVIYINQTQSKQFSNNETLFVNIDLKLNENKKAIDDCNDCLALDRTNLKAYMRKGQALLDENQFTEVKKRSLSFIQVPILTIPQPLLGK